VPGELVQEALEALMLPVWEVSGTDGVSLGAVGAEVDGEGPRLIDGVVGSLRDMVMRSAGLGMLGSSAPGYVIPAPCP
jgi:hypothetical protein